MFYVVQVVLVLTLQITLNGRKQYIKTTESKLK